MRRRVVSSGEVGDAKRRESDAFSKGLSLGRGLT